MCSYIIYYFSKNMGNGKPQTITIKIKKHLNIFSTFYSFAALCAFQSKIGPGRKGIQYILCRRNYLCI